MGNTQASNAILAKSRALYGRRLTGQDYQQLMNCRNLPEVITYLKSRTAYARALEGADPTRVRRAELEVRLRQNLFDQYAALCRYEMNIGHDFYRYFILKAEVRALANRLQELAAPGSETLRPFRCWPTPWPWRAALAAGPLPRRIWLPPGIWRGSPPWWRARFTTPFF